MEDEIVRSTLSDLAADSVLETDTDVFPVIAEEENTVVAAGEIASNGDTCKERKPSDIEKQQHHFIETSGKGTDVQSVEKTDEIKNKDVLRGKEDTAIRYMTPDKNPYDKAMGYLHEHSIPSLFQYIAINLAYQRPDDAIDFMIEEVTKRSQQKQQQQQQR